MLVRHGAVDHKARSAWAPVYDGHRYDFAPLSDRGCLQVEDLASTLASGAEATIISSPYTRTLQTAAILSRRLRARMGVDLSLHDWLPVRDGRVAISASVVADKIAEYDEW